MKNRLKKIAALMLICIMIISAVPFSSSAAERPVVHGNGDTYNHYPQVRVKGVGASCVKIYYEDDPEQKSLFYPIDTDRLKNNLNNIGDYIL